MLKLSEAAVFYLVKLPMQASPARLSPLPICKSPALHAIMEIILYISKELVIWNSKETLLYIGVGRRASQCEYWYRFGETAAGQGGTRHRKNCSGRRSGCCPESGLTFGASNPPPRPRTACTCTMRYSGCTTANLAQPAWTISAATFIWANWGKLSNPRNRRCCSLTKLTRRTWSSPTTCSENWIKWNFHSGNQGNGMPYS